MPPQPLYRAEQPRPPATGLRRSRLLMLGLVTLVVILLGAGLGQGPAPTQPSDPNPALTTSGPTRPDLLTEIKTLIGQPDR